MGGLEDGVAGVVVDVAAGGDADAADACRERVGDVVAVEVQCGDDFVFGRAQQNLLQKGIGDDVLDDDFSAIFFDDLPRAAVEVGRAVFLPGQCVTPVAERALGELHDVALVHEGDAVAVVGDGVLDGRPHDALGALLGHRLDADADGVGETDFLGALRECLGEELLELVAIIGAVLELDAGVNVLGVFAEDDHVGQLRLLHRTRHALEPAHRAQAGVQVENLAQGDIDRTDATADRRGERSLDADEIFAERGHGVVRQPFVEFVLGRLPCEYLEPGDLFGSTVGFVYGCVEDELARRPDIRAGAVAPYERDDRVVRHLQVAVRDGNLAAFGRGDVFVCHKSVLCSVAACKRRGGEGDPSQALGRLKFSSLTK